LEKPSLVVVGTGIRVIGQLTTEAIAWIEMSDKVLYLTHDPVACGIISQLNPSAESLAGFYAEAKLRKQSYVEMVGRVMECLRSGKKTCLVSYGHPGVFCWPGHEAIRQARREGYKARMLPGISAEDCLFADLGLDPATSGCQSYQATDFLVNDRQVDPSSLLILWQIEVIGIPVFRKKRGKLPALPLLVERLCRIYGPNHKAILYIAPMQLFGEPIIQRLPLQRLAKARLYGSSTLCIPPGRPTKPNVSIQKRLNLPLPEEAKAEKIQRRVGKVLAGRSPV
jgi:precorrin-6B methylase 1